MPTLSLPDRIKVMWLLLVDLGLELYGLFWFELLRLPPRIVNDCIYMQSDY